MTVTFRSSANVTNGTAGTSVVVNKPTGTVDGDFLVAFIGANDIGPVTGPAGWTPSGAILFSGVRLSAFRKFASSEGASWTWTLNASARNWGWVGAYTGVNTASPIYDTISGGGGPLTVFAPGVATVPSGALTITAAAGIRTATGVATTWTGDGTERADLSTNAGAGTDVAGSVQDIVNATVTVLDDSPFLLASQSQSSGVDMTLVVNPAFIGTYAGGTLAPMMEAAFGADPDADPATWTWVDITPYLRPNIVIGKAKDGEDSTSAPPTKVAFELNNVGGRFTPDNPTSPYYPNIRRNVPIRVTVPYGFTGRTERATAFVTQWPTRWTPGLTHCWMPVLAAGRAARTSRRKGLRSAIYRTVTGKANDPYRVAYWPCEDGPKATRIASAVPGVAPMSIYGSVSLSSSDAVPGSDRIPVLGTGGVLTGIVPAYSGPDLFYFRGLFHVPAAGIGSGQSLVTINTNGAVAYWKMIYAFGTGGSLKLQAFSAAGALIDETAQVATTIDGKPILLNVEAVQDGADVDVLWFVRKILPDGTAPDSSTAILSDTFPGTTVGKATGVVIGAEVGLTDVAAGHLMIGTSQTFVFGPLGMDAAIVGFAGETTTERYARLCTEERVPYQILGGEDTIAMGPQPLDRLSAALAECEAVNGGVVHDGGPGGALTLVGRAYRYNAAAALELDNDLGELAPGFEPTFDDQQLVNEVTVDRIDGSSATAAATASVAAEGIYPRSVTLNLFSDDLLDEQAVWRVHLGTTPGMRQPTIGWDLRAAPGLLQQWLACTVGSRVRVTNPPAEYGPGPIDLIIEGYTEYLDATIWRVVANTSPYQPYEVFQVAHTQYGRLDAASSTLATGIDTDDVTLSVATASGPLWTTAAGDRPFDIEIGGERMTVTNVTGASSPQTVTVTRSVNGVVKSHLSGASIHAWHGGVVAL